MGAFWPVMLSTMSLPLVGAVDVAMMGHLPDPAYVGGVALGGLIFGAIVLAFSFLRMGYHWPDLARTRGGPETGNKPHFDAQPAYRPDWQPLADYSASADFDAGVAFY